eukprot:937860-Amorphochlora_amoeboformis.AAC.1
MSPIEEPVIPPPIAPPAGPIPLGIARPISPAPPPPIAFWLNICVRDPCGGEPTELTTDGPPLPDRILRLAIWLI